MPINCINNDQKIIRVYTKMSERFPPEQIDTKLANPINVNYYNPEEASTSTSAENNINLPYDHIYASNTENNAETSVTAENCQSADLSEVKFWKDWLILHLDLIQQQNDDIIQKERTILILQQENEMLKERIRCLEQGPAFQATTKEYCQTNSHLDEDHLDMTQDSEEPEEEEDNKLSIDLVALKCENGDSVKPTNINEKHQLGDIESQSENLPQESNQDDNYLNHSDSIKIESEEQTYCNNSSAVYDFTISNTSETDSMRNLRMSIRRKRLSNSSTVSNSEPVEEKRPFRRVKKKRKRLDSHTLTTGEQYITDAGAPHLGIPNLVDLPAEPAISATLEVPRWRVKVYASCYTMEGTENLDDEVYNKRHQRLETDERRRKKWDVQMIRQQRVIEKLKQRQERTSSGSRIDEPIEPIQSLWPKLDDIKYIEVSDELPVSAFGYSIPKIAPSEFSLPWLNNPALLMTKKVPGKRSAVRRKNSKR